MFEKVSFGVADRLRTDTDKQNVVRAKRTCIVCPVRQQCLDTAMSEERYLGGTERHGVRGGLTAAERIKLAAQDPMCARCRDKPVAPYKEETKAKRLCNSCSISLQNDVLARYLPEI